MPARAEKEGLQARVVQGARVARGFLGERDVLTELLVPQVQTERRVWTGPTDSLEPDLRCSQLRLISCSGILASGCCWIIITVERDSRRGRNGWGGEEP
jgi:hypothetical protein